MFDLTAFSTCHYLQQLLTGVLSPEQFEKENNITFTIQSKEINADVLVSKKCSFVQIRSFTRTMYITPAVAKIWHRRPYAAGTL